MTRSASLILAAVLGGVVVGGIVWLTKPGAVYTPVPTHVVTSVQHTTPTASDSIVPIQTPTASQAPPWADGAGVMAGPSSTSIASAISASPRDPIKASQRDAIRVQIQELTANGRHPTLAEMNDVLGDLERVEGSPVVSGVNIGVLRKNLVAVDKLQKLALELQAESQKPGGADEQKVQDILEQLKQVQAGMNYNITAAAPAVTPQR